MIKEILIVVGRVVVGGVVGTAAIYAIYALVKYIKEQKDTGVTRERLYSDELNINEIKQWFAEKINPEDEVGVLFNPTEENLKKWELDMDIADNVILLMAYNQKADKVVSYCEIAFGEMSKKLKELLDSNGGTVVLER